MRTFLALLITLLIISPLSAQTRMMMTGTGFLVSNDGYIITNAHVVPGCSTLQAIQEDAAQPAEIINVDTVHDLALLHVAGVMPNFGKLRSNPLQINEGVVVVGHPGDAPLTTKAATLLALTGPNSLAGFIEFTSAAIPGNSGGPLLDTAGNIIGVVNAMTTVVQRNVTAARDDVIRNSNVAISLDVLRAFLNANHVRYTDSNSTPGTMSPDRVTDWSKQFVVKIHCIQ